MKIKEYLQSKYGVRTPTTITKAEAVAFGIPYPLTKGWLARHGDRSMELVNFAKLERKMQARGSKQARKNKKGVKHTSSALKIIGQVKSKPVARYELTKDWWDTDPKPEKKPTVSVSGDAFLGTYEWRVLRMKALKLHGARCQCCGATPATGAVMNVDHIKPRRIFPDLALDIDNLQVLCGACNHGKGNWDMTDWRNKANAI